MIFISYSTTKRDIADTILQRIRSAGISEVFLAHRVDDGIQLGAPFDDSLMAAMQKATTVLALLSPEWLVSSWCRAEYQTAILMGKRIIPVYLEDAETLKVPPELLHRQGVPLWQDEPHAMATLLEMLRLAASDRLSSLFQFREALTRYANTPLYDFPEVSESSILEWYVPPTLLHEKREQIPDRCSVETFLSNQDGARVSAIIGPAGIGKSTLLKYLAALAVTGNDSDGVEIAWEPMFVRLRNLLEIAEGTIAERMIGALRSLPRFHFAGDTIPPDFLASWRSASRREWIFLLDALDEVPSGRLRDAGTFIEDLCAAFPGSRVLVTARSESQFADAFGTPLPNGLDRIKYELYRIEPPNSEQADQIAKHWRAAAPGGESEPRYKHRVGEISNTPLGIAMLSVVSRTNSELIANRYVLYKRFVNLLVEGLGRRGDSLDPLKTPGVATTLLQVIALASYEHEMEINEDVAAQQLAPVLESLDLASSRERAILDARNLLKLLIEHSGLFEGKAWRHTSFCEYLAAEHVAQHVSPNDPGFLVRLTDEFKRGRTGLAGFIFSKWNSTLKSQEDVDFEPFRPSFEALLGSRPSPSWWRRLFLDRPTQTTRIGTVAIDGRQAASICHWIADLGGAPPDIEDDALSIVMTHWREIAKEYPKICRSIFGRSEYEEQKDVIEDWSASLRLQRKVEPWVTQFVNDLPSEQDQEIALGTCIMALHLGAEERILKLIETSDKRDAVYEVIFPALGFMERSVADRIGRKLIATIAQLDLMAQERFSKVVSTAQLLTEIYAAPSTNELALWAKSNPQQPLANDVMVLTEFFAIVKRKALIDESTQFSPLLKKRLAVVQRQIGPESTDIDFLLAAFDRYELDLLMRDKTIPEAFRTYLHWRLHEVHPDRKSGFKALWTNYCIQVYRDARSQTVNAKQKLRTLVARETLIEWLSEDQDLDHYRTLLSVEGDSWNDLQAVVAEILNNPEVCPTAKLALLEFQYSWTKRRKEGESDALSGPLLQTYGDWLVDHSEDWDVLLARAELLYDLDAQERALVDFDHLVRIKTDAGQVPSGHILQRRAYILWYLEREPEALCDIDMALRLDDSVPYRWYLRALILRDLERPREGIASIQRAIEFGEAEPRFFKVKAECLADIGKLDEALVAIRSAVDSKEDIPATWTELNAWLLSCAGYYQESETLLAEGSPNSNAFHAVAARIQNAILQCNMDHARRLCLAIEDKADWDSFLTSLSLLVLEGQNRINILNELVAQEQPKDMVNAQTFWVAVARGDTEVAEMAVERMITSADEANLRWLFLDYSRFFEPLVGAWVQGLVARANFEADVIAESADEKIELPSKPQQLEAIQQAPQQNRRVKHTFLPFGLDCPLERIETYDEEYEIASLILKRSKGATMVIIPLLDTGYLYVQTNRKRGPGHVHNFKLWLPFATSQHRSGLADIVRQYDFQKVVITDPLFFERLSETREWRDLRRRLVLDEHPLPYTAEEVSFE